MGSSAHGMVAVGHHSYVFFSLEFVLLEVAVNDCWN